MDKFDYFDANLRGLYCNERAYIVCAQYFHIENYPLALSKTWNLQWLSEESLICGERIKDGRDPETTCNEMEHICGIYLQHNKTYDAITASKVIPNLLEGKKPIGLLIDLYWCKWTRHYQRNHSNHIIIVVKRINEGYLCIDPNFSTKIELLTDNDFLLCFKAYYEVNLNPDTFNVNIEDCLSNLNYESINNIPKNLISFSNYITSNVDWTKEFQYKDTFDVPLIYNLYLIIGGRLMFEKFLLYLDSFGIYSNTRNMINLFEASITEWNKLYNIIKKYYILHKTLPQYKFDKALENILILESKTVEEVKKIALLK